MSCNIWWRNRPDRCPPTHNCNARGKKTDTLNPVGRFYRGTIGTWLNQEHSMTSMATLERPKWLLRQSRCHGSYQFAARSIRVLSRVWWEYRCGVSAVIGGDELPPLLKTLTVINLKSRARGVRVLSRRVRRSHFHCVAVPATGTRIVQLKLQPHDIHTRPTYSLSHLSLPCSALANLELSSSLRPPRVESVVVPEQNHQIHRVIAVIRE